MQLLVDNKNGVKLVSVKDTLMYCPVCGDRPVYVEEGEGDYYEGPEHFCARCGSTFFIPNITKCGYNIKVI